MAKLGEALESARGTRISASTLPFSVDRAILRFCTELRRSGRARSHFVPYSVKRESAGMCLAELIDLRDGRAHTAVHCGRNTSSVSTWSLDQDRTNELAGVVMRSCNFNQRSSERGAVVVWRD